MHALLSPLGALRESNTPWLRAFSVPPCERQTTIGGANWLWLEMELSTAKMPTLPPEAVSAIQGLIDSVRIWSFTTSVGSRLVQVMCSAPYLKGAATTEETGVASARTDCAGILKRISFTTR